MAKSTSLKDTFGQMVFCSVAEGVANYGMTTQFNPAGANQEAKFALVIHRAEYVIPPSAEALLLAADDSISFGLAAWSVSFSASPQQTAGILDCNIMQLFDFAGVRAAQIRSGIVLKDFSMFPGGGLLCHPSTFYAWVKGTSLASTVPLITVRAFYTTIPLADIMYQELFQMQIINSIVAGM